jgi:hypothetical protein
VNNPRDAPLSGLNEIQGPMGLNGDAAPEQRLGLELFRQFWTRPEELGDETDGVGKILSLAFQRYMEHPDPSPYATCTSI